jgi:hypothetical protein
MVELAQGGLCKTRIITIHQANFRNIEKATSGKPKSIRRQNRDRVEPRLGRRLIREHPHVADGHHPLG